MLATGFVLLGEVGESASLLLAAGLNLLAASCAVVVRPSFAPTASAVAPVEVSEYAPVVRRLAYAAFFLSGFTALAYEVIWARLLVLFLETSIYSFSTMLAIFLAFIALGSWSATWRGPSARPLAEFGRLEIAIGCTTVLGLLAFPWLEPAPDPFATMLTFAITDWYRIACAFVVVAPPAFCFGRQFPVAVRCCASRATGTGRHVGRTYAVNAIGTILGSVGTGFCPVAAHPAPRRTAIALAAANVICGILLLACAPAAERRRLLPFSAAALVVFVAAVPFVGNPYLRVLTGRFAIMQGCGINLFAFHEGGNATAAAAGLDGNRMTKDALGRRHRHDDPDDRKPKSSLTSSRICSRADPKQVLS